MAVSAAHATPAIARTEAELVEHLGVADIGAHLAGAGGGQSAWRLFNAFTEVMKTRSPRQQMEHSLRLTRVFREVLL